MPTLTHVPARKRWTREACADLGSSGVFEQERLELVAGELISKVGASRPHVNALTLMLIWLQQTFGADFVNPEAPIAVHPGDNPINEPEPNIIVLKRDFTTFRSGNPQPHDLSLVVEIADSSLNFDLSVKAALYAGAAIVEYWVLDVTGRRLFCHREPASGNYRNVVIYQEDEPLTALAAPDIPICARQVLSPA